MHFVYASLLWGMPLLTAAAQLPQSEEAGVDHPRNGEDAADDGTQSRQEL